MKLLSHSFCRACCILCILATSMAINAGDFNNVSTSKETLTSHSSNSLGSDEMKYITLECEAFAKEDGVSNEHRSNYIKTCITELSTAVQNAIDKLQIQPDPAVNVIKEKM